MIEDIANRRLPSKNEVNITEKIVQAYQRLPDFDMDASVEANLHLDELKELAEKNLGLNRQNVETAYTTYRQHLIDTGRPVDSDPILEFMAGQLAFNSTMTTTVTQMNDYAARIEQARIKRELEPQNIPFSSEMPTNFYNSRQMESYMRTDSLMTQITPEVMSELGIDNYRLYRQFGQTKLLWVKRKYMYYVLGFEGTDKEDPPKKRYFSDLVKSVWIMYGEKGRFTPDWMHVPYSIPILMPPRNTSSSLTVEEAWQYSTSLGSTELRYPTISTYDITPDNIRKLVSLIGLPRSRQPKMLTN